MKESDYKAGTRFQIYLKYLWFDSPAKDYTVSIYSKQDLIIYDKTGNTNKVYMDGQRPTGFRNSDYTGMGEYHPSKMVITNRGPINPPRPEFKAEEFQPKSLEDVLAIHPSFADLVVILWHHPWVLLWWFNV